MSLEVLTKKRTNGLPVQVSINGRPSEFVRGFLYTPPNIVPNGSSKTEIELVYEDLEYRLLYLVTPHSLDVVKNAESKIFDSAIEDLRYLLFGPFGSKKLYKTFFDFVNEAKIRDLITDGAYIYIVHGVNNALNVMRSEQRDALSFLGQWATMEETRRMLENDPVIGPYVKRAKSSLKDEHPKNNYFIAMLQRVWLYI